MTRTLARRVLSALRPSRRAERGSAAIEVVGLSFVVLMVFAMAAQVASAVYASQAADRAAWDAARAQSLGHSAHAAADASLPGAVHLVSVSAGGSRASVTVRAPDVFPVLDLPTITRTAYVP